MSEKLSTKERKNLRKLAHHLKPVVMIGQHGFSEAVTNEIDGALSAHGIIKIRVRGFERQEREDKSEEIAQKLGAEVVGIIGGVVTIYRKLAESD